MTEIATFYRVYAATELGPDGYPPAWHETIKHDVRAATSNRCARCSHPYTTGQHGDGEWSPCDARCTHDGRVRVWVETEGDPDDANWLEISALRPVGELILESDRQPYEAHWRILTVHHLDGDKANCRWWNLAALCQRCHLTIQGRVRMGQVYPYEHSDWFKPYAAGWYAHVYLGEELSRAEVEARLDELLALERVA